MTALPVMLSLRDRRCLIVGGGDVAVRRASALLSAQAQLTVVAPTIDARLARQPGVTLHQRPFQASDLDGVMLVVIATNDDDVNEAVAQEAGRRGVLINHAQRPELGDVTIPAHRRLGPLTITAHTDNVSAAAAAEICQQLADTLDPNWPTLLTEAAPYRRMIQTRFSDEHQRRARLRRLCDATAMSVLREHGVDALREHLRGLVEEVAA